MKINRIRIDINTKKAEGGNHESGEEQESEEK